MARRHFVIVGGGGAGIEAAAALRQADPEARIAVWTDEDVPYYARIRLGEVVDGRSRPEDLFLRLPSWWDEQRIELRLGVTAEGIDPAQGRVRDREGTWTPWDALLLATGARPFLPPIPGIDRPEVVTLRRMRDALAIRDRLAEGRRAVVLGGGLLGLELAASLARAGLGTTVVEAAPWLLPRQVDREGGEVLRAVLEQKGIGFRLGTTALGLEGGAGTGCRVGLSSGESLEADLVPVMAGVRAETSLARSAGLEVASGIRVDDGMRTSAPGVFAAGDCAEHRSGLYGFWSAATEQGRAAGRAMATGGGPYQGSLRATTLKVTDVALFSIGDLQGPAAREERHREGDRYRCIRLDGEGRVLGAVLIGDLGLRKSLTLAMMSGKEWDPQQGGRP
ncbi:NAD(P)/FAD-dependent oxidoreductase [Myxococcota bacterium]|nr:NAD(P)/FAD-dependent oxidoreductase [Myxococcota bacterium]